MQKMIQIWLVLSALISILVSASGEVTWKLDDYNDWNLPFAKTIEIVGRNDTDRHALTLAQNSYKLEVDPSAYFSVLFLDESQFPSPDEYSSGLKTLDYAPYGSNSLLTGAKGIWGDVTMIIPADLEASSSITNYTVNITMFIAKYDPPEAGLKGTLALC